jgi:hypothetical protein
MKAKKIEIYEIIMLSLLATMLATCPALFILPDLIIPIMSSEDYKV